MDIQCRNLVDRRGRDLHADRRRHPDDATRAIILHQTAGNTFLSERHQRRLASPGDHRLDRISAHFVILQNGAIYYTHDFTSYRSGSAGRRHGIDIEFAGDFPSGSNPDPHQRVPRPMITAGRELVAALVAQVGTITHIHPHGQVQGRQRVDNSICGGRTSGNPCGSLGNCPGPDIWVNVGAWASRPASDGPGLTAGRPLAGLGFPDRGIDPQQTNPRYRRSVQAQILRSGGRLLPL